MCAVLVTLVVSDSVRSHRRQPTRLPVPGILQARTLEWAAISFFCMDYMQLKKNVLRRIISETAQGVERLALTRAGADSLGTIVIL